MGFEARMNILLFIKVEILVLLLNPIGPLHLSPPIMLMIEHGIGYHILST